MKSANWGFAFAALFGSLALTNFTLVLAKDLPSNPLVAIRPSASAIGPNSRDMQNALRTGAVEIEFEALRELALSEPGGRPNVLLEPFEGHVVELDGESLFVNHAATVVGRLANDESGVFILSWAGTTIYGMLEAGLSRYIFESDSKYAWGTLRVKLVNPASFYPCGTASSSKDDGAGWVDKLGHAAKGGGGTEIEIMALYTPAMADNHSGDPAAYINTLEASVTAAFSASSVTGNAKIVRYKEINFTESAPFDEVDFGVTREYIQGGTSPFTNIPTERGNYRADLVALLIDGDAIGDESPNFAICGIADAVNSGNGNIAYTVVGDTCASGDLTFAHEITHLLGGRHDWGNTGSLDPTPGWTPGTGHGYTSSSPDFRTVMAGRSNCSFGGGCARLSRYSDPDQTATIMGSPYALGVADDWAGEPGNQRTDMVDVLASSVSTVASYQTSGDSAPGQPASMTVDRLCSGSNELSWPAASGTVGWYEVQSSTSSGYSPTVDEYRGGKESIFLFVSGTRWVRVRACNAEGCGSWRNGSQTATTTCP